MILIGVKSKYGSCNGNCTGLIIFKFDAYFYAFIVNNFIIVYSVFVGQVNIGSIPN